MNVFVFQSVPSRYDLREVIQEGADATWYATRYRNEMHVGDLVFFWMAGDEDIRGLYGWGRITSPPYMKEDWDSHGVDVTYHTKFSAPVLATTLRKDSVLSSMLIFRAPQATNFLLNSDETEHLIKHISEARQPAPSIAGDRS
jgi:hypothetical protein